MGRIDQPKRSAIASLDREECLSLLKTQRIGRIGIVTTTGPLILPVNYELDGEDVIVRTSDGSKLDAARETQRVCFEVDKIVASERLGWSVIIKGPMSLSDPVEEPPESGRGWLPPWRGEEDCPWWLRIQAESISGRRIRGVRPVN